ncbi:MAG: nitrogenase component 1 [Deltaproteobacteria bacterium]|nr:nitrogenase component 1 [Deltaproteobacteria bacterium]
MNLTESETDLENQNSIGFIDPVQGDKMLGAFRVACGIKGAVVLIHAPVGCHWGVNFIERLSSVKTNASISALRERSVVFGGEDSLRKTIEIILKNRKKRYLILLAGSVSSIIGEDWQGVIDSVGFGFHSIAIDCGGYLGKMGDGYEECMAELCKWMDDPEPGRDKSVPKVNLIGLQRDIVRGEADIRELIRILGLVKIDVNSVFPPATLTELKRAPNIDLNIVLGYGTVLAKRMEERWGIPWVLFDEYPYGLVATRDFVQGVGNRIGIDSHHMDKRFQREEAKALKALRQAQLYLPALYEFPVAISADLPQAKGLARFLATEVGMDIRGIHITASPGSVDEEIGLKNICSDILFQASWDRFEILIEKRDVKLMLGSDLERHISLKKNVSLILISYPTTSRLTLTSLPYMGFRGVLTLIEEMVNSVLAERTCPPQIPKAN